MQFNYKKLRKLREDRKYSLENLSMKLKERSNVKISRAGIALWETGETLPSVRHLMAIAVFYGTDINYFFKE